MLTKSGRDLDCVQARDSRGHKGQQSTGTQGAVCVRQAVHAGLCQAVLVIQKRGLDADIVPVDTLELVHKVDQRTVDDKAVIRPEEPMNTALCPIVADLARHPN